MAKTYFISYAGQDKECALWIAGVLEEQHQTVRIQAWDIRPGDNFISKMHDYIKECDVCVPVLSQAYLESDFCEAEWTNFYAMAAKRKEKRLIPVRITDVNPDGLFQTLVYIDLYNIHDDKEREQKLLSDLEEASRRKPSFPITYLKPRALFHGALLPNNLPDRNLCFSGREGQLNEIHTQFQSGGAGCVKQTITGLGGIGKTQTVTEYAWRFISEYKDAVWLVNAETEMSAFNDCLGFAKAVGLIPENMDETKELTPQQLAGHLRSWFAAHSSWLFIFDNVEQGEVIALYTSAVQTGHLLITTRSRELKQGKSVAIDLFTLDEAAQFMRDRLSENIDLLDSETALTALIGRMSCFPLALEQAGAYMESTQRSCLGYLSLLDKAGTLKTLAAKQSAPTNYRLAVNETLALSFDKLSESARQLFNLCAYMSPDGIPLTFFARQLEKLPNPLKEEFNDELKQDELIAELFNYSLVKRDGDYLGIHRLLQEIGRERAKCDETDWLEICLNAVFKDLFDMAGFNNREQREQFARIAGHGLAIAELAERAYENNADKETQIGYIYYLLGCGSHERARYEQALLWFNKSLAFYEKTLGNDHMFVSAVCDGIAAIYARQSDHANELEWKLRQLAIYEKTFGERDPSVISSYNGVSQTYVGLNDYPKALEYNKKASLLSERELGAEHPETASTYEHTAHIYSMLGDYPEAMKWSLKALTINRSVFGDDHPTTAYTYNNIADNCYNRSDYPGALEWYRKALAVHEKKLGAEHPSTAQICDNIARTCNKQGDHSGALEWYQKALEIREEVLGLEHPDTAETYRGMAYVCNDQGDHTGARNWLLKALEIYEKVLDAKHPSTAQVCEYIAMTCQKQGDHSGALEWYKKALSICEEMLGVGHIDTALTYAGIALVIFDQGDYSGALEWYLKSYKGFLLNFGDSHPNTKSIKDNMEATYSLASLDEPFETWFERTSGL